MTYRLAVAAFSCLVLPAGARAELKPETLSEFYCYVQSAEARMNARKTFVLADADAALNTQLLRGQKIVTSAPNGDNPHKITGGNLYDWVGSVFVPGATIQRTLLMLQDYDHRPQYFPQTISSSKLLCRTGENHLAYTMRMKEPAVIDVENDVVWTQVDPKRWKCSSYSTSVKPVEKDKGYVRQIYMWWRFAEAEKGVYVEAEAIELSDEFGAMTRALGSMLMGINPEKSLRHSLEAIRTSLTKPGLQFAPLPSGLPACGEPYKPAGCTKVSERK
ncbi:MAG: hypothetical protein LAQ30_16900 [Acidobacteriia bacterium]|nr:hypothetical protein [Terriglobia bacterium]